MIPWGLSLSAVWFLYKSTEAACCHRARKRIPVRIHVIGTRGKSQTVRLILAGLRAGGMRAVGKTTGEVPTFIDEKGNPHALRRHAPARIAEQVSLLRWAARRRADAVVVECMAIRPELIRAETRILVPHLTVLTNVRPDHCDIWGPTKKDAAAALAAGVFGGKLFAPESERIAEVWGSFLRKTKTELFEVPEGYAGSLSRTPLPLRLRLENLSLALKVCEHLGVNRHKALEAMLVEQIPNAFGLWEINWKGRKFLFANAFTANDPRSTEYLLGQAMKYIGPLSLIGLFNNRRDRLFRVRLFSHFVREHRFHRLFLLGDPVPGWRSRFPGALPLWGRRNPEEIWDEVLASHTDGPPLCFGFGNFKGMGAVLSSWVERHASRSV